jgi:hypothetical protein
MDINILQQPQQQSQNTSTQSQQIHVVRTNYQTDQQSPGQQIKLPDHLLETNAFAKKTESPQSNLLNMTNEHKEFSCSVGDESLVNPPSNNLNVDIKNPESDESNPKLAENEGSFKALGIDEKDGLQAKNPNLSVATNIANAFINISSLNTGPKSSNGNPAAAQAKNVNVIVTQQPITHHFMKTLSFTTSRGGIFVPNVIATNITPQFTVHQYGLHGNPNGPAPNVTVNPNGNFNSNSNAIRPGAPNHFRLLFHQAPNLNLNAVNNQPAANTPTNPPSILETSLQTLNKVASVPISAKVIPTKTSVPNASKHQKIIQPLTLPKQSSIEEETNETAQAQDSSNINSDQHIRVLTPSEIMKTLPSLSSQDNVCFGSSSSNDKVPKDMKIQNTFTLNSDTSGSVAISFENSTNCSPLKVTSECNTLSSNFVTTKATSSNNAQMVSG